MEEAIISSKIISLIKDYRPDIIVITGHDAYYAKKNNIPVVATMHSQYEKDIKRALKNRIIAKYINKILMKKIFDKCDECWAVNSEVARIFYEDYKCKTRPKVMNNATEMLPVEDKKKSRYIIENRYNIKKDEKIFLFVGRINLLKNILFIVDSLKLLKTTYPEIKFKMLFVGSGQDELKLKKYIIQTEMQEEIIMCGRIIEREELAKYYSAADLFLFPSLYDASSVVQIEAASQKTPGVFIREAATAATIIDNVNGYIAENTPEKYSEKIAEIINNQTRYKEICENTYRDLYVNWDDKIDEIYSLYMNLITRMKK